MTYYGQDSLSIMDTALSDPHPSYKNPTIIQATCEIRFISSREERVSAASLYKVFGEEFPEIQPVPNLTVVMMQPAALPPQEAPQNPNAAAFRFATSDGKRYVQISSSNFVYQSNEPYFGWPHFRGKILELLALAFKQVEPDNIARIGVRYINRIIKTHAYPALDNWLQATSDLPLALIQSKDHFLARIESSPASSHLKLITLANETPGPDWPNGAIIMDIDRICNELFEADDVEPISRKLEELHDDVWVTFSAAATDTLKQHLNGSLK